MKDNTTERDTQGMAITSQVKGTSTKNKPTRNGIQLIG